MRILLNLQCLGLPSEATNLEAFSLDEVHSLIAAAGDHEISVMLDGFLTQPSVSLGRHFTELLGRRNVLFSPAIANEPRWIASKTRARLSAVEDVFKASVIEELKPELVDHGLLTDGHVRARLFKKIAPRGGPWTNVAHLSRASSDWPKAAFMSAEAELNRCRADLLISPSDYHRSLAERSGARIDRIKVLRPMFRRPAAPEASGVRLGVSPRDAICYHSTGGDVREFRSFLRSYILLPPALQWGNAIEVFCPNSAAIASYYRVAMQFGLGDLITIFSSEDISRVAFSEYKVCVFSVEAGAPGYLALEAIAVGAASIIIGRSSASELVKDEVVSFRPEEFRKIADCLSGCLTDYEALNSLRAKGSKLLEVVSSRDYGQEIISLYEEVRELRGARTVSYTSMLRPPKITFYSPLPPLATGVADYSVDLIKALSEHYDVHCVVEQNEVTDPWILENCKIFKYDALPELSNYFGAVYNIGNSEFHNYILEALSLRPGISILHDFSLGHLFAWAVHSGRMSMSQFRNEIYQSHGVVGLYAYLKHGHEKSYHKLAMSSFVFNKSKSVVVHSRHALQMTRAYGAAAIEKTSIIPMLRAVQNFPDKASARKLCGILPGAFVVATFGMITPSKKCEVLLEAWKRSALGRRDGSKLIFVGDGDGPAGEKLRSIIDGSGAADVIAVGRVTAEMYSAFMASADIVVQLREGSRGETSKAVMDAMAFGKPLILNAHGSASEWPDDALLKISDPIDLSELASAIDYLSENEAVMSQMALHAQSVVSQGHSPAMVAERLKGILERSEAPTATDRRAVVDLLAELAAQGGEDGADLEAQVLSFVRAELKAVGLPQIFVDVTVLADMDAHTGIQRVVKAIFQEMIDNPPVGYRIEPVVLHNGRPRYARSFINRYFGETFSNDGPDEVVPCRAGDKFLALDWVPDRYPATEPWFGRFRALGGRVVTVVYDLIPLKSPEFFPENTEQNFRRWIMACIRSSDTIACISEAVADDLKALILASNLEVHAASVAHFGLGADLVDLQVSATELRDVDIPKMKRGKTVLMVGTLEPRKGYLAAIRAFMELWSARIDINLVIVGRGGWQCEDIKAEIRAASIYKRLHWLYDASDQALEILYQTADILLSSSYDEGFGLPLAEAAQHGLPVIARDIPIFREIAPDAMFFSSDASLPDVLRRWHAQPASVRGDGVSGRSLRSWRQSAAELVDILLSAAGIEGSAVGKRDIAYVDSE